MGCRSQHDRTDEAGAGCLSVAESTVDISRENILGRRLPSRAPSGSDRWAALAAPDTAAASTADSARSEPCRRGWLLWLGRAAGVRPKCCGGPCHTLVADEDAGRPGHQTLDRAL